MKKLLFLLPILLFSLCSSVRGMDSGDNNFGDNFNEFFPNGLAGFSEEFYKPSEDEDDLFGGLVQQTGGGFDSPFLFSEAGFLDIHTPETENMLNITDSPSPLSEPFFLNSPVRDSRFYDNEGNKLIESPLKKIKKKKHKKVKKKKIKKKKKEDFEYLPESESQDEDDNQFVGKRKFARKKTKKSRRRYKCDSKGCKKVFFSKGDLWEHKMGVGHYTEKEKKKRPWGCDVCGRRYMEKKYLVCHQRKKGHNPPERKEKNPQRKRKKTERERKSYDQKEKPWKCGVCGKRYVEKNSLTLHQRRKGHNPPEIKRKIYEKDEKPWKCDCGKSYRYERGLILHQREKGHNLPESKRKKRKRTGGIDIEKKKRKLTK